jgi:hypothetical protein
VRGWGIVALRKEAFGSTGFYRGSLGNRNSRHSQIGRKRYRCTSLTLGVMFVPDGESRWSSERSCKNKSMWPLGRGLELGRAYTYSVGVSILYISL